MEQKTRGILEIILAIAIVALVFFFSDKIAALSEFGYLGVFLISLLSSATILIPAPGWAVVIALGLVLNPFYVGIAAGIGSGIGEITGYIAGKGAIDIMKDERFNKIKEWIGKNDVIAIFILAFIPNPLFDVAGIIAGSLKIPWWRFLLSCAAGRVLRFILLAYVGEFTLAAF